MHDEKKLKLVVSRGKPDDFSLEQEIGSLESAICDNCKDITTFYAFYMANDYDDEAIAEIYGERVSFDLPDIHEMIKGYYPDYRRNSKLNDKEDLHIAIAESIDSIGQNQFGFKGILPGIGEGLYMSISDMYPEPENFIADYEALRSLQKEDAKPAVYWLARVILNAYEYSDLELYKLAQGYIKKSRDEGRFEDAVSIIRATKNHIRANNENANL